MRAGLAALVLIVLWVMAIGPEPPARTAISPDELVRAVTIQRDSLVDLCLMERVDPNGRDEKGRTPLLIATSQQDWKTARRPSEELQELIAGKNEFANERHQTVEEIDIHSNRGVLASRFGARFFEQT